MQIFFPPFSFSSLDFPNWSAVKSAVRLGSHRASKTELNIVVTAS